MDELNFGIYKVNLTRYEYDRLVNKAYTADLMIEYLLNEMQLSTYITSDGKPTIHGTTDAGDLLKVVAPKKYAERIAKLTEDANNA